MHKSVTEADSVKLSVYLHTLCTVMWVLKVRNGYVGAELGERHETKMTLVTFFGEEVNDVGILRFRRLFSTGGCCLAYYPLKLLDTNYSVVQNKNTSLVQDFHFGFRI